MSSIADAAPSVPDPTPTRVFGPSRPVVVASLVIALVFVVVLEFLVGTSFVGQRLWAHPALFTELWFTLPLLLWLAVLAVAVVLVLRTVTAWMQVDETSCTLRGLCRRTRRVRWEDVHDVLAVHDIERRGAAPSELLEGDETFDGVYLLDQDRRILVSLPARLVGGAGQRTAIARAHEAGVEVELVARMSPAQLRERVRRPLGFADLHPGLMALGLVVFYAGHNLLTFIVWGM